MVSARLAALAFVASVAAQSDPAPIETAPVVCPPAGSPYLMIGPGCMIPCFSHGYGNLATLVGNITSYYPGTSTYTVPYTNSSIQGQVSTPVFIAQAKAVYAACPASPIVMVGHSLGGIIVMNTLCGGGFPYTTNVVAAVTYGEETYVGGQSYDSGTCTSNAPNFTRASTAGCQKWAPVIHDYCLADDAKCCATGTSIAIHQEYAMYYDVAAFAFIKAQLAAFVAPIISSSSSSSVASSTTTVVVSSSTASSTVSSTASSSASSADSTSTLTTTVATTSYSTISVSTASGSSYSNSSVPVVPASSTAAASGSESVAPASTTTESAAPASTTTESETVAPASPIPTTVTTVVPISFTSVVSGSTIVISASLTTAVPGIVVSSSFQETYPYPNVPLTAVAQSLTGAEQSSYLAAVTSASLSLASEASAAKATPVEASTKTSTVVRLTPSAEGAPSASGAAGAGVGPASSTEKAGSKPSGTSAGVLPTYTGAASQLSMPVSLCIAIAALMFFQA